MTAKLHGYVLSPNVTRVLLVAYELNIPLENVYVTIQDPHIKQADYLSKQPFGQIPLYEESSGFTVFESRAIARYLDITHGGTLGGSKDPKKYAAIESWSSAELSSFNPAAVVLNFHLIWNPNPNAEVIAENKKKLSATLDVYEKQLAKHPYLAGDEYTLADLYHVPLVGAILIKTAPELLEGRPNVKAWVDRLAARPSSQKIYKQFEDAFPKKN